jgi:hypothetical protein
MQLETGPSLSCATTDVPISSAARLPPPQDAPLGWQMATIGSRSATWGDGWTFTESNSSSLFFSVATGLDIWSSSDGFHFLHRSGRSTPADTQRPATGFRALLRLSRDDRTNVHSWAKVGLMLRSSLSRSAVHVSCLHAHPNGPTRAETYVQWRPSQGNVSGSSSYTTSSGRTPVPYWIRLTRSGDTISCEFSLDASGSPPPGSWSVVDTVTLAPGALPADFLWGMAASAHATAVPRDQPLAVSYEEPFAEAFCPPGTCAHGDCVREGDSWPDSPGVTNCTCHAGWIGPRCDVPAGTTGASTGITTALIATGAPTTMPTTTGAGKSGARDASSSAQGDSSAVWIIVAVAVGALCLVGLAVAFLVAAKRRRGGQSSKSPSSLVLEPVTTSAPNSEQQSPSGQYRSVLELQQELSPGDSSDYGPVPHDPPSVTDSEYRGLPTPYSDTPAVPAGDAGEYHNRVVHNEDEPEYHNIRR